MKNNYSPPLKLKLLLVFLLSSFIVISQKNNSKTEVVPVFPSVELYRILQTRINVFRSQAGLDSLERNSVLDKASDKSTETMAKEGKADVMSGGKSPGDKLSKVGGTKKADELVIWLISDKGKKHYSALELADIIMGKWTVGKREKAVLLDPHWVFCGFSQAVDKPGKKHYISCMFGGFDSFNSGAKKKNELKVPFNTKSKKLKGTDLKVCKNCNLWKDYDKLREGLTVEKNKIYLNYNNLRYLKKLLVRPKDGFAIDVVQFAQYEKDNYNILDNNLQSKGIMQKPIYRDNIFSKNLIKFDKTAKKKAIVNKLKLLVGTLPSGIKGDYELNLIVVSEGRVCKTILRSWVSNGEQSSSTPLDMIVIPEAESSKVPAFEPRSETSILNFIIPFEKGKSEFKQEDVKPFVDAMQEPDFNIEGLYIYAYSSIEGDSLGNSKLQRKRGESITSVLQLMQKTKLKPIIMTNDSWALFQMEMEDGKYDYLTKMTKHQAIKAINSKLSLQKELEPTLAKQRFAQIVMDVTYDISGTKEEKFAYLKFNQAVRQENYKLAYKIMDFIYLKVKNGEYNHSTWDALEIPFEKRCAGLLMMKKYYEYLEKDKNVDEEDYKDVSKISDLDAINDYLKFNKLYCKIKVDSTVGDLKIQSDIQSLIDGFYKSEIPKKNVDGLNIEWNFKLIDYYDTIENMESKIEACVEKIKKFYNFKESSWQNSLKLSYVFARSKDYEFAANIIEPFVKLKEGNDELLFEYISLASHISAKFYSRTFSDALASAKDRNLERYCKLFGSPFMSFQVLDNPNIKKVYKEANCTK